VVQTNGRPAPLDTSDHGRPIGEGRDAVAVADQHIARVHPEGAIHEVPAPPEVRQYGVDPLVVTRNRVTAGDVPMDIVGQQRPNRRVVTAGVESLLGLLEPSQQLDGFGSIP
jgi:hypothetical protein